MARDEVWALGAVSSCCLGEEKDEGSGLSLEAHINRAQEHTLLKGTLQQGREDTLLPRTGTDLGRLWEAVGPPLVARVCTCWPGCYMAAFPGDLQRSLLT